MCGESDSNLSLLDLHATTVYIMILEWITHMYIGEKRHMVCGTTILYICSWIVSDMK